MLSVPRNTQALCKSSNPAHSRTPTWQGEHCSGQAIQTNHPRLERLETISNNTRSYPSNYQANTIHRPVCDTAQHPTANIHELETRPRGNRDKCLCSQLGTPTLPVHVSSDDSNRTSTSKAHKRKGTASYLNCSSLAIQTMVARPPISNGSTTHKTTSGHRPANRRNGEPSSSNSQQQDDTHGMRRIRDLLTARGIPEHASTIICRSWSLATLKSYDCAWRKLEHWCSQNDTNYLQPSLNDLLSFLVESFESKNSTSWTATFRSAISTILEVTQGSLIGKNALVSRLLKGMTNIEPKKPRYTNTLDVNALLTHLGLMQDTSLKDISHKTAMLLALTTASRCSELVLLNKSQMEIFPNKVTCHISGSKTWNKKIVKPLHIHRFPNNSSIFPLTSLERYISATETLRNNTTLFITLVKPHNSVSVSTVGR